MGIGIIVCGLNGSGKSTLGKALAEKLGFRFIDNEDLFFPKTDPHYLYALPRTHEEAEALLIQEVRTHKNFVFAAVKGHYAEGILPPYQYAVVIEVPKAIRLQRVKDRSFRKFGSRMLPGGDLYEQEKAFLDMVSARSAYYVEEWVQTLKCPILRVDGTKPIDENVALILQEIDAICNLRTDSL